MSPDFARSSRSDRSASATIPRYLTIVSIADLTFAGAYFAAFLKPWSDCFACCFVGAELFASGMCDSALQNFVFLDGATPWAGPATTASSDAASTAATTIRRRTMPEPLLDVRPSSLMLLSGRNGPVAHLATGGVGERDARSCAEGRFAATGPRSAVVLDGHGADRGRCALRGVDLDPVVACRDAVAHRDRHAVLVGHVRPTGGQVVDTALHRHCDRRSPRHTRARRVGAARH